MIILNNNFEYKVESQNRQKRLLHYIRCQYTRETNHISKFINQDNPNFYTNIKQKVSEFENDHIIMCGD